MSNEISPYGVGPHVGPGGSQTANALVGELAGSTFAERAAPGAGPALLSTAPYKGRNREERDRLELRKLKQQINDTHTDKMCEAPNSKIPGALCRGYKCKGQRYCVGHMKTLGKEAQSEPAGDS